MGPGYSLPLRNSRIHHNPSPRGGDCRNVSLFRGGKCRFRAQRICHRCANRLFARFFRTAPVALRNMFGPPQLQAAYRPGVPARASRVPELACPRERGGGDPDPRHPGGIRLWFQRLGVFFTHAGRPDKRLSPDLCGPARPAFSFWFFVGRDERISFLGHLIVAGIVALTVSVVWARPFPFSCKAAVLCIGSAMVPPYILYYDFLSHHRRRLSRSRWHVARISPRRANGNSHLLRRPLPPTGPHRPRCLLYSPFSQVHRYFASADLIKLAVPEEVRILRSRPSQSISYLVVRNTLRLRLHDARRTNVVCSEEEH